MNHPIHSIQYIKKKYKTYQFITIIFVTATILTEIAAAVSGFQISRMQDRLEKAVISTENKPNNEGALENQIAELKSQLVENNQQLSAEKQQSKKLMKRVSELEADLKKLHQDRPPVAITPPAAPAPSPIKPEPSHDSGIEANIEPTLSPGDVAKPPPASSMPTEANDGIKNGPVTEPNEADDKKLEGEVEQQIELPASTDPPLAPAPAIDSENTMAPSQLKPEDQQTTD